MTLTKKQREWLRDVKERCKRDYFNRFIGRSPDEILTPNGYQAWESWRLADLCEKLSKQPVIKGASRAELNADRRNAIARGIADVGCKRSPPHC